MTHDDRLGIVQALSLILAIAAFVPAGAHLAEFPNKMRLPLDQYMIAQRIYDGWALFAVPIFGAIAALLAHTILVRRKPRAFSLSLSALLAVVATQAVFWAYTYPMNALTRQWTVTPDDLEAVRLQWEASHAVNAVIMIGALVALTLSIFATRRNPCA